MSAPVPGRPEKEAVRSMFDRIAPRYDLLNRLLSAGIDRRWRRTAVDFLELPAGACVLDVATGTADLLTETLCRDRRHRGWGVDISHEMLVRARVKLARSGLEDRGAVVRGDAERLPFRGASFDGALIAFGIRNVADRHAGLSEMYRVLRPGGRAAVLEFSMPKGWLGPLYRFYFRNVLPRLGAWISGDRAAYAYLPASVAEFPSPRAFASSMEQAGFLRVCWQALSGGIVVLHRGEKRD